MNTIGLLRGLQIFRDNYLAIWEHFMFHYGRYFELLEEYRDYRPLFQFIPDTSIDKPALEHIKALNVRKFLLLDSKIIDYDSNDLSNEYYSCYHERLDNHGAIKPTNVVRQILDILPDIALWFLHSKKVYRLSENFYSLMCHTDIDGFSLSDVNFPFKSYLIALPHTLSIMQNQIEISHVLFQKYKVNQEWRIRVILLGPTLMKKYDEIKVYEKRFEKSFQKDKPAGYLTHLGNWMDNFRIPMIDFAVDQNISLGGLYDHIAKDDESSADAFLLAFKIALYFMAVENKTDETIKQKKETAVFPLKKGSSKEISVDIFEIDTSYSTSSVSNSNKEGKKVLI